MQSIEVVGGLIFAVIVGILIIQTITGINFENIYDVFSQSLSPQTDLGTFEKVNSLGVIKRANECWTACRFGQEVETCSIILAQKSPGIDDLNSGYIRNQFAKFNFCSECKVSIEGESIELPSVISLSCGQVCGGCPDLTGDNESEGIVDQEDLMAVKALLPAPNEAPRCSGDAGFDAAFDLDGDGCITQQDVECVVAAFAEETTCADPVSPGPSPFETFDAGYNGILIE
jgi:hypothetical protein